MPGFNKDCTNILCQGSTKTVRTFCARVQQRQYVYLRQGSTKITTVAYYCMKVMPGFNKGGSTFMPGFNKNGTYIYARVQQRRHEHLCQGSTKTVGTFPPGINIDGYVPLFENYVPCFNKDAKYRVLLSEVSTIIQQGMWYIDSIIQLSQNIGPGFNKDASYHALVSEVSTIIQQGMWYIDSIIQLSQNIRPGFNKDANYHVLLSEVCAGLDKGGIIIANIIRLS